jgi:3-hydroxybutyryl-CoA dehydrogenase
MEIKKVGVVGAGQMGGGIAQVAATKGYQIVLRDLTVPFLERGMAAIEKSLAKLESKDRLGGQSAQEIRDRITTTTEMKDLADCDFVIEAIVENLDAKETLFEQLGEIVKPEAILASNTSSISVTALAKASGRPERFLGVHFMNPVALMQLVEMIRGLETTDATYQAAHAWVVSLGKTPIVCRDYPGFISNRVLMPMINEAIFALYEGVADREAIDGIMKLGMNHPMGPLTLADFIGLDTCLAIMKVLYEGFADSKYRPCPLLVKMVEAGQLGKKTGKGFYEY